LGKSETGSTAVHKLLQVPYRGAITEVLTLRGQLNARRVSDLLLPREHLVAVPLTAKKKSGDWIEKKRKSLEGKGSKRDGDTVCG